MERKHICILPDSVPLDSSNSSSSSSSCSSSSRFLRLPHPRTSQPALFLPHTRDSSASTLDGILEVQKLALDADKQRSWFLENEVVSDGNISILSPFDPLFLVLSYLSILPSHFVSYSDLWDSVSQHCFNPPVAKGEKESKDEEDALFSDDIIELSRLECVKARLEKVCETQIYDSTTLYRLSPSLILEVLKAKVDALSDSIDGIFGSFESTDPGEGKAPEKQGLQEEEEGGTPRVVVNLSKPFPVVSRGMGREGVGSGQGLSEQIQRESRQKYSIGIISNYLPPALSHTLLSAYEFPSLTSFLSSSHTTSSFLNTTYLPGRGGGGSSKLVDGGDSGALALGGGNAAAQAKKRKLESKGSRGVEALKKVNVKGMKSLKEMFGGAVNSTGKGKAVAAVAKGKKK